MTSGAFPSPSGVFHSPRVKHPSRLQDGGRKCVSVGVESGSDGGAWSTNELALSMASLCSAPWQGISRAEHLGLHAEDSKQKPLSAAPATMQLLVLTASRALRSGTIHQLFTSPSEAAGGGACGDRAEQEARAAMDASSGRHLLNSTSKTQRGAAPSTSWGWHGGPTRHLLNGRGRQLEEPRSSR